MPLAGGLGVISVNPFPTGGGRGQIMPIALLTAHPVLGSYWHPWFEFSDGHKIMKVFIFLGLWVSYQLAIQDCFKPCC